MQQFKLARTQQPMVSVPRVSHAAVREAVGWASFHLNNGLQLFRAGGRIRSLAAV